MLNREWRILLLMASSFLTFACSTDGTTSSAQIEAKDATGFTVVQDLRVGPQVRADFRQAMHLLESDDPEGGIALLEKVTKAAPHAASALIDLGIAYGRVENWEGARTSLERAIETSPRHPVAHNELGIVYRKLGRFEDARESYQRALALYPDFHVARRNLAILCDLYLADTACAVKHYELYNQAVPEDADVAMWTADLKNRSEE